MIRGIKLDFVCVCMSVCVCALLNRFRGRLKEKRGLEREKGTERAREDKFNFILTIHKV